MSEDYNSNKYISEFLKDAQKLLNPDRTEWITGDEQQLKKLREIACQSGELIELNQQLLPGCYLHRTHSDDVARDEDKTFICCKKEEDAGPLNNFMESKKAYKKGSEILNGAMKGRTMYVVPFSMGVISSKFSKIGICVTDSIYIVLSLNILARVSMKVLDVVKDGDNFVKIIHSKAQLDVNKRLLLHFTEDNTIWSMNSEYDGLLLSKKSFGLRIASCMARDEGWLAEHMLIVGIENPQKEVYYIAAAFPSSCGKKNIAMLVPPEIYKNKGYKVWCVGDDVAWLKVGDDGRLWAMNPENGFFGVAPGTNEKSNPNGLISTRKDTIFTNVVHNLDSNTVWWEGLDDNPPNHAKNWRGEPWNGDSCSKGAHANARYISPAKNCPNISKEFNSVNGVPITAIVFGGRRSKRVPLVYQSRDWNDGVFTGSIMASETTPATTGDVGVIRRDPMAMRPFIGYNVADYFEHFIEMGKKIINKPQIFNVNWFKKDESGKYIWPGYNENFRVLQWIIKRCEGTVDAEETPIGYLPYPCDINIEGLQNISENTISELTHVDMESWKKECVEIKEFYDKIGEKLPEKLLEYLKQMEEKLEICQQEFEKRNKYNIE